MSTKTPYTDRPECESCGTNVYSKVATLGDEVECYSCSIGDTPEEDREDGDE